MSEYGEQGHYEQEQYEQEGEPEDWLAGARIGAGTEPFELGNVQIALNDMNLPDDGTAYA